jgi:hypothetical protein
MFVSEFNDTLLSFLDELYRITQEKVLKKYHILVESNIEDDDCKNKFIEHFILHALEYQEKILQRDASFFLSKDFHELPMLGKEVDDAKRIFRSLAQPNQDVVFDYVIHLLRCAEGHAVAKLKLIETNTKRK